MILKCIICHDDFSNKEALKTHIASVHEGKKPHKCQICGKKFSQVSNMKNHIVVVHDKKKE